MGPILAGGPVVAWIVGALEEAALVGGLTAFGAGIYSIGVPKDSVLKYETAIKTGKYVLIVHGSAAEIKDAKEIINSTGSESSEFY
jgi:predicted alpha/beta-hydrolase family hydrolase